MQRFKSLFRIFSRMTTFGIVLGAIAGALVAFALTLTLPDFWSTGSFVENLVAGVAIGGIWGGMFGGLYGGVSGFIAGLAMTVVTAIGYALVRNPRNYKIVMGTLTALSTGGIFMLGGLWDMGMEMDFGFSWVSAMILSIVIAVYMSQITAKKYITETQFHKEKVK